MPFAKINGINLYYEVHGEGTPLLLVGGYTQHSGCWKANLELLSRHFKVIIFDNRGSGQSEAPPEDYTIELFAQDTIGLMDALSIENAHLMGQSMGTCICQRIAIDHPERVRKVVLCAPFATLPPISKNHAIRMLYLLTSGVPKDKLLLLNASWLLSNSFVAQEGNVETFVRNFLADPIQQTPEGLRGQAHALFTADLCDEIEQIPHEVLLLVGGKDILTPPTCAELIHEKIPSTEMHIFKEMGHLFNFEIPDQSGKRALNFLLN